MAGVKGKSGGYRENAGRKPKADEIKLIERLDEHIDKDAVLQVLYQKVIDGDMKAIQLYMNYRYGRPKETVDLNVKEDRPIFNLDE